MLSAMSIAGSQGPRVLFVSKPIVPPWNDGSKNLVRDLATHVTGATATVLTTSVDSGLGPRVRCEPVYASPGRFAPSVFANARVFRRLLLGDGHDVWHFVFAPNAVSGVGALVARELRATFGWRGSVVQTLASAPRSFDGVTRWLFGDVIVALSEWTRGRLLGAGVRGRDVRVIPPCARAPRKVGEDERRATRERYELGSGPVVLYPGDYEVSRGAETVARATRRLLRAVPEAHVIFACRQKTPAATKGAKRIGQLLHEQGAMGRVRLLGDVDDMPALLAISSVLAFPVDDLFAKVDLPLVLLEALALGLPLVLARGGPLEALHCGRFVEPGDADAVANQVLDLLHNPADVAQEGQALYRERYEPSKVAAVYDALYAELFAKRR